MYSSNQIDFIITCLTNDFKDCQPHQAQIDFDINSRHFNIVVKSIKTNDEIEFTIKTFISDQVVFEKSIGHSFPAKDFDSRVILYATDILTEMEHQFCIAPYL